MTLALFRYEWWLWLRDFLSTVFGSQLFSGLLLGLLGAIIGGFIAGRYSLRAVNAGFDNERNLAEREERARQSVARHAICIEMLDNLGRLAVLTKRAAGKTPIGVMMSNLRLSRVGLDAYLPLIAGGVGLKVANLILTAYSSASMVLAGIEGKWSTIASIPGRSAYGGAFNAAPEEDRKALQDCADGFRQSLDKIVTRLLTEEERRDFGDPQTVRAQ